MAYDRTQQAMLPQTGYFLSQPRINLVPSLQNVVPGSAQQSVFPRAIHFSLPFAGYQDSYLNDPNTTSSSNYLTYYNSYDVNERDYQIITYKELEKLLPDPKPTGRVELGILPNGCAYAPKTATKENYLLFPSKLNYILYFTHHYFSRENLCRDQTFVNMLVNKLTLPLEKLIRAPRLAALNTTIEEVERALISSKIVCIEDMGDGVFGVRRIDGYPCLSLTSDYSFSSSTDASYSTSTTPNSFVSLSQVFQNHRLRSSESSVKSDSIQNELTELANKTGSLELVSDKHLPVSDSETDSVQNNSSVSLGQSNQSVDCTLINRTTSVSSLSQDYENHKNLSTIQAAMGSSGVHFDRPLIQQPVRQHTSHGLITQSLTTEVGSIPLNYTAPIMGFYPRTTFASSNLHPSDMQNITILPLRPAALPHYFVGQPGFIQASYPTHLGYPQVSTAFSNFNLNMAAVLASVNGVHTPDVHVHQPANNHPCLPSVYYTGQFLPGNGNQFNTSVATIGHQSSSSLASSNHYQVAAIAAMAAASQQQTPNSSNPSYIHSHTLPPTQLNLPVYYAAQQYPLQSNIIPPRHPIQRVPQNLTYPIQSYSYPSIPMGSNVDMSEAACKNDLSHCTYSANPNNFAAYPLLFQSQPISLQPNNKSVAFTNLAAAAQVAGLQLNCAQSNRPYAGLTHIPLNLAFISSASFSNSSMTHSYHSTTPPSTNTKSLSGISGSLKTAKSNESTIVNKHDLIETNICTPPLAAESPGSSSGKSTIVVPSVNNTLVSFAPTTDKIGNNHENGSLKLQSSNEKMFTGFLDDSEDSSSGIGDMTLPNINEHDKQTNPSCTLTGQDVKSSIPSSIQFSIPVHSNT